MDNLKALEEYADTTHFLISIANDLGYKSHEYQEVETMDLNKLVIAIINMVSMLPKYKTQISLIFSHFIKFGNQLGFSETEVIAAYDDKNKVNYERQKQNYLLILLMIKATVKKIKTDSDCR